MGQGLGKNSPVQLSLTKSNYEALISRHGQWIRWRTAIKCSCCSLPSMQPDIHCKICEGRGYTFTYQKTQTVTSVAILYNEQGIIDIESDYQDGTLVEVYDYFGKRYSNAVKDGNYIYLNEEVLPVKGTYFYSVLTISNEKKIEFAVAKKEALGFYSISGLASQKPSVEGLYYEAQGDIVDIEEIKDANGELYTAQEFRLNQFRIEPKTKVITDEDTGEETEKTVEIAEPLTVKNVTYVPPFTFAILNQNLSKADTEVLSELRGDAICLFPYNCDVSEGDILTVLSGSFVNKEVMARTEFETDTLAAYFVYDIVSITGIVNDKLIKYEQNVDYILVGTNKIKWLDTENVPEEGESYSVTYHLLPTYKVIKEIPQLRTSENQRFPKKAVVKLNSTYSEAIGANKQVVGRFAQNGSY